MFRGRGGRGKKREKDTQEGRGKKDPPGGGVGEFSNLPLGGEKKGRKVGEALSPSKTFLPSSFDVEKGSSTLTLTWGRGEIGHLLFHFAVSERKKGGRERGEGRSPAAPRIGPL